MYKESDQVNGKRSFTSTDNTTAIWYNPPATDWVFGTVQNLGKDIGLIHSEYDDEKTVCPQEIPFNQWKWYSMDSIGTWSRPIGNQFQIQCGKKLYTILIADK